MHACLACLDIHMEARGQLLGVGFLLLLCGLEDWTHVRLSQLSSPLAHIFEALKSKIRQHHLFDFWGGLEMAEYHGSSTSQSQWLHLKQKRERPKSHNPNSEQEPQWPTKLPLGLILKSPKTNHYFNYGNKHK